jgi:hypothetical protein
MAWRRGRNSRHKLAKNRRRIISPTADNHLM